MRKINIGIIGCGYWGPNFVRNFNQIKDVYVKYVCDLHSKRLQHIKELYPDIITSKKYLQILSDRDIDAVIITTPANTHYKLTKDVLLYNKHALTEKPIATKINDAEELISIAKKNKRILMVGHTFEFNPGVNELKKLISSNTLGRIYYSYSHRTNLGPLRKDVNAMWDLAPHDISIFNYLFDKLPSSVTARGEKYLPHRLEDVCFITLTYPKKILAHIHVSWLDPKKVREIIIVGSKKMAIFNDLDNNAPISVYDKSVIKKKFKQQYDSFEEFQMIIKNGKVSIPKIDKVEPLNIECKHFIESIRKNKSPLTDGIDGLKVLKVLIAAQQSLSNYGKQIFL